MNIESIPSSEKEVSEFRIRIKGKEVQEDVMHWIAEKAKTVSLDGFRKGKVPLSVVEKHFLQQGIEKVLSKRVDEAQKRVIQDNNLRPAIDPELDVETFYDHAAADDMVFRMKVSHFPEVVLKDFDSILLEKLIVDVPDAEVDEALAKASADFVHFVPAPENHDVQHGDRVEFSVATFLGKTRLKDFSIKKIKIPVNFEDENSFSQVFFSTVMNALRGRKKDETVSLTHTFEDADKDASVRGKTVDVTVHVLDIDVKKTYPVGEELAVAMELESLEALRLALKKQLEKDYQSIARLHQKRHLLDALSAEYPLSVPRVLVDREFQSIWSRLEKESDEPLTDEVRKEYEVIADRRVRLGLVIGQVSKEHHVVVSDDMVRRAIWDEVRRHPQDEREIIRFYEKNPSAVAYLRSTLLEDLVVDYLMEKTLSTEVHVTPAQLKEKMKDILPGYGDDDVVEAA